MPYTEREMVVYLEYAILENFMIDGALLYLSVKCAKARTKWYRLTSAAALGAAEAVVFPLIALPVWAQYLTKFLGGLLLPLLAVSGKKFKPYAIAAAVFFFLTFALGGLLTAAYSFFGLTFAEGEGYRIGQAPVGIVLGAALLFFCIVLVAAKKFYRYRKLAKNLLSCTLTEGGRDFHWQGYADSGNRLTFRGKPVCVASPAAVFALFGRSAKAAGRMTVSTVNGEKDSPVFECESIEIAIGRKRFRKEGVYLTVGEVGKDCQLILSTALMEA